MNHDAHVLANMAAIGPLDCRAAGCEGRETGGTSMTADPRATAYCKRCCENLPVRYVLQTWRRQKYEATCVGLPDNTRYLLVRLRCGHQKTIATTIGNLACIRRHIASGQELLV